MDRLLIFTQLTLGMIGVLGVAASEPDLWPRQLGNLMVGLVIVWGVSRFSPKTITKLSPYAYLILLFLLVLVLFIGVSPTGSESRRWLPLPFGTVQPSEFMKVTVIAYLTAFFYNHLGDWHIWRPMFVIGIAAGLIILEPNVSTALFIFALCFAIMIAAGTSLFRLMSITTAAAIITLLFAMPYLSQYPYVQGRLEAWRDARGPQEDSHGGSFQTLQAQRTLQRAGFFGIGPGRPFHVPEADTDMVSVSIAHSLGLTGIITLIGLYLIVAGRGISIAAALSGPGSLLAAGATIYICAQAGLNLLVASGLVPITGVVLPFVSYGFNSLVSVAIAMGFLHSAYRQGRREGVCT